MHGNVPPWPEQPPAAGSVRLRAFRAADVAMVRALATDPYVPLVMTVPAGADEEEALAWIARQHRRPAEGRGWSFCVADRDTDEALGQVGLWTPSGPLEAVRTGRAHLGYAISPTARGRRAATDAVRAVTGFGWSLPWLFRVEAYVEPDNTASRRTVEAAGFAAEGLLRSHQPIGGTRRDMLLYALLRPAEPSGPPEPPGGR
ncbi:RimJ/RimL family protein N-acetyltransferase [Friedmanniella endophytica]|uniref:RimJ/RimL family protein N-acetyltransferase n=1 Tax=Microlunatus kandeliicorticis TaxID=1759536 RepID=A0A7W3IUM3_9ACTN|nr:GNAT family N-acetyltransferase [Microlunatus kandeliicorticis]MBA8795430.1 RimJ/RimL family protein N-acetyltransferase [Microlunatus kandeliicorticis]